MTVLEAIATLDALRARGVLADREYERAKRRILEAATEQELDEQSD